MKKSLVVLILLGAISVSSHGFAAEKLTYVDLVSRLNDLQVLATLPEKGEKCGAVFELSPGQPLR